MPVTHITFQSSLSRKERLESCENSSWHSQFQSTLPRRERLSASAIGRLSGNFNPRSHEGNDYVGKLTGRRDVGFQSTLPRKERHDNRSAPASIVCISIHAPAKGATVALDHNRRRIDISIHAPARGATQMVNQVPNLP